MDNIPPGEANITPRKPRPKVMAFCQKCECRGLELVHYDYRYEQCTTRCTHCGHERVDPWAQIRGLEEVS